VPRIQQNIRERIIEMKRETKALTKHGIHVCCSDRKPIIVLVLENERWFERRLRCNRRVSGAGRSRVSGGGGVALIGDGRNHLKMRCTTTTIGCYVLHVGEKRVGT
jgi:hypothetical protein